MTSSGSQTGSPCEMTSTKVLVLIIAVLATALIFYGISTVDAVPEIDMYLDRIVEEIGNYTGEYNVKLLDGNFVSEYLQNIEKELTKSLPK